MSEQWKFDGDSWKFMEDVRWILLFSALKDEGNSRNVLHEMGDPDFVDQEAEKRGMTLPAVASECVRLGKTFQRIYAMLAARDVAVHEAVANGLEGEDLYAHCEGDEYQRAFRDGYIEGFSMGSQ